METRHQIGKAVTAEMQDSHARESVASYWVQPKMGSISCRLWMYGSPQEQHAANYLRAACMSSGLRPSTAGALLSSRPRLFSVKPHDCSAATAASSCASGKVSRAAGKAATTRLIWPGDRPRKRRSLTCRHISNLIRLQYGVLRATSTDATDMTVLEV